MENKNSDSIIIEILDSSQVPENELKYFEETQPLEVEDIIIEEDITNPQQTKEKTRKIKSHQYKHENEEILIQKYVNGEVAFNEFYNSFNDDDEDEEETDDDEKPILDEDSEVNKCELLPSSSSLSTINDTSIKKEQEERSKEKRGHHHQKKSILTAALQGLMGEANLCFVRGQIDIAEKICLEIIRQNPLASEPFFTLAQIYENKDPDKFLEFLTIAAHLDPTNRDQWIRIAEINIEKKKFNEARSCYSKAIKYFPKDYEIRILRSKLLELMGEYNLSMISLMRMLAILPSDKYEYCLETAKKVASHFYKNQKMKYALEAMQNAYKVAGKYFTSEDINLYLELLVINKYYYRILTVLKDFGQIEYITEKSDIDSNEIIIVACTFFDDMLPEYRIKASVSLIHLKAFHLIEYIIQNMFECVLIETNIEGYIDIAEAMMQEKKYEETLIFLEKILNTENIEIPPYIWLRHAECHCAIENILEAIESYQKVVELAPFCYDAKFALSALLKKQGKHKEALKALEQDLDAETFNPKVLHEYCLMLKSVNEIDQYIEGGYVLLARNSLKLRTREEMLQASSGGNFYKPGTIKSIVEWRLDNSAKEEEILDIKDNELSLSVDDEYNLFKDLLQMCFMRNKYGMMQKLCFAMITSKKFRTKFKELEKLIIITSLYNDDPLIAFMFLREILSRNPNKKIYWNINNMLIQKYDSVRYYRYFKRLLDRIKTESYYKIFIANYHLSVGSYKYALNLYITIFKDINDPLLALCIMVVFSQMSSQKKSLKRQTAAAQAIAFARKYKELRLSTFQSSSTSSSSLYNEITGQEVYYNIGRIYHYAGLPHLAIKYYTEALNINNDFINKYENILSLREEIAYNLHLIYKAHGNYDMARKYLYKYITV